VQAIVKETKSRRQDYFPSISVRPFGHSENADCLGGPTSSGLTFCHLFRQEMESLYLLAFLLTVNPEMAEQCFISSLEECLGGIAINEEWVHSWAKRVVIKSSIKVGAPHVQHSRSKMLPGEKEGESSEPSSDHQTLFNILLLGDFERFVFVMTVLEGLSDRDSAILLGCSPDRIRTARMRALQEIVPGGAGKTRHTS
jgi:hypothetical protein